MRVYTVGLSGTTDDFRREPRVKHWYQHFHELVADGAGDAMVKAMNGITEENFKVTEISITDKTT